MTEPLAVKAREAAQLLGVTERRVYELVKARELKVRYPYKGTRNFVIEYDSLRAWLASRPDDPEDLL